MSRGGLSSVRNSLKSLFEGFVGMPLWDAFLLQQKPALASVRMVGKPRVQGHGDGAEEPPDSRYR